LAAHRLTFSTILEEVPLKVRTNALLSAFVSVLGKPTGSRPAAVPPSFSALDLGAASLSRTLERTLEALDASRAEENNAAYHARQIGRAKAQAEAALQKRRDENVVRTAQGLQPLPEDDVLRAYKIPPEPSRLDGLLLLGQVDAHARALEDAASLGLAKMYAARGTADV
jgi:translation initiation factor 3 subunit H